VGEVSAAKALLGSKADVNAKVRTNVSSLLRLSKDDLSNPSYQQNNVDSLTSELGGFPFTPLRWAQNYHRKRVEFPSGLSHFPERRWVHDAGTSSPRLHPHKH
jgi:hypothetical protein